MTVAFCTAVGFLITDQVQVVHGSETWLGDGRGARGSFPSPVRFLELIHHLEPCRVVVEFEQGVDVRALQLSDVTGVPYGVGVVDGFEQRPLR